MVILISAIKKAFLNLLNNATNKNEYQLNFVEKFKSLY